MATTSQIGRRIPRSDAAEKATGEARYASDITPARMLHGKILRSPLPHARLLNIDVSRALRLPGVKAVVTGKDTAGINYGYLGISERHKDKLALAIEKVRFIGDEIAAVAAVDEDTAREALELIRVDFEELPAVFDPEAAMRPDAPLVHSHAERNISRKFKYAYGDVEEGFARACCVREEQFTTSLNAHATLETHVAVAMYGAPGSLTVWTSTQTPFNVQQDLALTLQLPRSNVRVIKPHTGGGFGAKGDGMDTPDFCAALLSIKTGRPVRVANDRDEEFMVTRRRHPSTMYWKMGVARDGTLLAIDCRVMSDGGAYCSQGAIAPILFGSRLHVPYRQRALRFEGYRIYTNKPPCGAMRGFTAPQMHFAQDVLLERLAREIGMSPEEIRIKNGLVGGETALANFYIASSGFKQTVQAASAAAPAHTGGHGSTARGWGIGSSSFPCGAFFRVRPGTEAFSEVMVRAHPDGTVTVMAGAADVGQGSDTILCQMVAEELTIPFSSVRIISADTGITPHDYGAYASRITLMSGSAARDAAIGVRQQLLEAMAHQLEANFDDLVLEDGRIHVKGSPEKGASFAEAVKAAHSLRGGRDVMALGSFVPTAKETPCFSFGTSGADVEIDQETGQVTVHKMVAAHDCGVPINPLAVEGQLHGAVHFGLAFAVTEEVRMDGGQTLNPSMLDYKVPTALETPEIEVILVDNVDPEGPYGSKEAGEGTVGPNAPAIANAIYNGAGVEINSLPITPEAMLRALEEKGRQTAE